ncbi:hypothetical protein HDU76_009175, partial [Blyttiomyces sp. JEL0837]
MATPTVPGAGVVVIGLPGSAPSPSPSNNNPFGSGDISSQDRYQPSVYIDVALVASVTLWVVTLLVVVIYSYRESLSLRRDIAKLREEQRHALSMPIFRSSSRHNEKDKSTRLQAQSQAQQDQQPHGPPSVPQSQSERNTSQKQQQHPKVQLKLRTSSDFVIGLKDHDEDDNEDVDADEHHQKGTSMMIPPKISTTAPTPVNETPGKYNGKSNSWFIPSTPTTLSILEAVAAGLTNDDDLDDSNKNNNNENDGSDSMNVVGGFRSSFDFGGAGGDKDKDESIRAPPPVASGTTGGNGTFGRNKKGKSSAVGPNNESFAMDYLKPRNVVNENSVGARGGGHHLGDEASSVVFVSSAEG